MRVPSTFSIGRGIIVVMMLVSWLVLTNHCALARLQSSPGGEEEVPACHRKASQEKDGKPCSEQIACCKTLKASLLEKVKFDPEQFQIGVLSIFEGVCVEVAAPATSEFVDHGPPRSLSFAEVVLQRSLLSHAPPVLS